MQIDIDYVFFFKEHKFHLITMKSGMFIEVDKMFLVQV